MIRKSVLAFLLLALSGGVGMGLTSCTNSLLDELPAQGQQSLYDVTITIGGLDLTTAPLTRATATEAGVTRISLAVFTADGAEVTSVSQIASEVGNDFNRLSLQLPAGNYTFVAVAHDASADNIGCASIISPEVVTLPEKYIPTLYSSVKEVTITNSNNQSVAIEMGKRINATLRIVSSDLVPEGVTRMAVDINLEGATLTTANLPQFNPATGFAIGDYRFARGLSVITGETIDVSMNLLLPEDSHSFPVAIHAQDASNQTISDYDRSLESVPFQRAYVTNASGQFFRYVNSSSLTFDTTSGTIETTF